MKLRKLLFVLPLLAFASGCAVKSNYMQTVDAEPVKASADQATVVFLRPSLYGGAIQASLFKVGEDVEDFIGISSAKTKLAYPVSPGKHRFMVIGESADFLDATVEAGKTYYAVVSPRMGFWKARFSLFPVRNARPGKFRLEDESFPEWLASTDWVVKTPAAEEWYQANRQDIRDKQQKYIVAWLNKSDAEKDDATLYPDDAK